MRLIGPDWAAAERNIVRLKPSAFAMRPASVRSYLEKRTCTIPLAISFDKHPNNVVRGRFTTAAQVDIAVRCSVGGESTILLFRGGVVSIPPTLDPDGIDDYFVNKASIVRYWFRGKWLALSGQD